MDTVTGHTIGGRLRALRHAAGRTQASLATAIGASPSWVGAIELGRYRPDAGHVSAWVEACGGSPEDLQQVVAMTPEAVAYGPESDQEAP